MLPVLSFLGLNPYIQADIGYFKPKFFGRQQVLNV